MGQVALGFRSLLIKLVVFVALSAALAWALGGTLFPRPEVATTQPVFFAGDQWYWKLSVGGRNAGEVKWELIRESERDAAVEFVDRTWVDVAGPVVAGDALYIAGQTSNGSAPSWKIQWIDAAGNTTAFPMPDRLAVEQQLARLANGLPLQDVQTIEQQRLIVLDPASNPADTTQ